MAVNGFRIIGSRKAKLLEILQKRIAVLHKKGVDTKYLAKYLGINTERKILGIPTKKISGIISELNNI